MLTLLKGACEKVFSKFAEPSNDPTDSTIWTAKAHIKLRSGDKIYFDFSGCTLPDADISYSVTENRTGDDNNYAVYEGTHDSRGNLLSDFNQTEVKPTLADELLPGAKAEFLNSFPIYTLPSTGGEGTDIRMIILGAMLAASGITVLTFNALRRKRRSA